MGLMARKEKTNIDYTIRDVVELTYDVIGNQRYHNKLQQHRTLQNDISYHGLCRIQNKFCLDFPKMI